MDARRYAIDQVAEHCDLSERLKLLPPSASSRGFFFRSIDNVLERAGKMDRFERIFPERISGLRYYPVSELLIRLTVGAALLRGPEQVHAGMFEIGRNNVSAVMGSLLGKMMLRFLAIDPRLLLQQGVAGKRQTSNFGRWDLSFPEEHTAQVSMTEEYLYIESYMLGAAQGTFEAVGVPVSVKASLVDRFTGTHTLRWGPSCEDSPS
ncbi:MAG: TIGR02265 family protein [Myxococcales bacterium]